MIVCPVCNGELAKCGTKKNRQNYRCKNCGKQTLRPLIHVLDKKEGSADWREWSSHLKNGQKLHEKSSYSQTKCTIEINTDKKYIIYQPLSDIHLGSIGCNYEQLENFTNEILARNDLFFSTHGDHIDGFFRFKNQLTVHQMQMSPEDQIRFLESWIEEVRHKFLFSTWGNHEEMEEKASGMNTTKRILGKRLVYFNGIGLAQLLVNGIEYKIAATHKTRYNSSFNRTHGLKQLARRDIPDADIYLSGHTHDPGFEYSFERGFWQLFVVLGSMKENDGYAKRYFAYHSSQQMTTIVLNAEKKEIIPFHNINQAIYFVQGDK